MYIMRRISSAFDRMAPVRMCPAQFTWFAHVEKVHVTPEVEVGIG
jgi:hypothetical protein